MRLINSMSFYLGIGVDIFSMKMGKVFAVANIYGAMENKVGYQENVLAHNFLEKEKLMLGGDTNSKQKVDIWGNATRANPLAYYFKKF